MNTKRLAGIRDRADAARRRADEITGLVDEMARLRDRNRVLRNACLLASECGKIKRGRDAETSAARAAIREALKCEESYT